MIERAGRSLEAVLCAAQRRPRLALLALVAASYATSLGGPFQFDDYGVIVNHAPASSLSAWWGSLGHGLRPLLGLTYAANASLGLGPPAFHLVNVMVHVVNAWLVLALLQAAFTANAAPAAHASTPAVSVGALIGAAVYAVHPIQTEAVTYISGRSSSLAATWYLAALLLHSRGTRSGARWQHLVLAPLAFACALFTKESAATLPLAMLLWDALIERPGIRRVLLDQLLWWAVLVVMLIVWIHRPSSFSLLHGVVGAKPVVAALLSQMQGVGYLVSRLVLVDRLSIDPGLGFSPPPLGLVVLGTAMLIAAIYAAVRTKAAQPVIALGCLWFALHLLLPHAVFPRDDVLNERHAYLAMAGLGIATAAAWDWVVPKATHPRLAAAFAMALIVVLAAQTGRRGLDYRTEVALWESTVRTSPANPRAHYNLGVAYEADGQAESAGVAYRRALALEPRFERARLRLERATAGPSSR